MTGMGSVLLFIQIALRPFSKNIKVIFFKIAIDSCLDSAAVDAVLLHNQPKWDIAQPLRNAFDKDYYASAHRSVELIMPGAPGCWS